VRPAGAVTCGVLVTDGVRLLLGHATRSPRWDIFKGLAEPGEDFSTAACRELLEETGLAVAPETLVPLGRHRYLPGKALELFEWRLAVLPDPATLRCSSRFMAGGVSLPELDRFAVCTWDEAILRVGKNLARVLAAVRDQREATGG